ncbi:MAG: hypothetical protein K6T65_14610 [Peptococcaceae bacterium]|nr:hypothetical protein [Peptococcaceae bacterium]
MLTTRQLELLRQIKKWAYGVAITADEFIEEVREKIEFEKGVEGARAWVEDGVLRITVDECLPGRYDGNSDLRLHWIRKIMGALDGIDVRFKKALCIIEVYFPNKKTRDVDHRQYGYVLNGLVYAGVVNDDDYNTLSFMVTGNTSEEPKTEIYVIEHPESIRGIISKLQNPS